MKNHFAAQAAAALLAIASCTAQAQFVLIADNAGNSVSDLGGTQARAELSCSGMSCPGRIGGSYVAAVSASLGTGSVRAFIHSDDIPTTSVFGPLTVTASATAGDTLTFHGSRPEMVDFTIAVDGGFGIVDFGGHRVDSTLTVSGLGSNNAFIVWGGPIADEPTAAYFASGPVTNVSMIPAFISLTQHVRVLVTPEVPISVTEYFKVQVKPSYASFADADFNHTAQLGIALPDGWSFTSQSGVFLTQAVPEPGRAWLLLVGLVGLAVAAGRRRRRFHLACGALLATHLGTASAWNVTAVANPCGPGLSFSSGGVGMAQVDTGLVSVRIGDIHSTDFGECQAMAAAVLGTGQLRTRAFADTTPAHLSPGSTLALSAAASAQLTDTLRFALPAGASSNGPALATITLTVVGRFSGMPGSFSHFSHSSQLLLHDLTDGTSPATAHAYITWTWNQLAAPGGSPLASPVSMANVDFMSLSNVASQLHATLTARIPVVAGHQIELFTQDDSEADASLWGMALADFSHTAQLAVTPPAGWTFTSDSGLLLAPVPEPGTGALFVAGLALLGRRRLRALAPLLLAAPAWALNGGEISTRAVRTDLYPQQGPVTPVADAKSVTLPQYSLGSTLQSDSWFSSGGVDWAGGGHAFARATETALNGGTLEFGSAAIARSLGNLTGSAHAHVVASYDVEVLITPPADPLLAVFWINTALYRCGHGCVLKQDWLHMTDGRLAYATRTDRTASFSESLTITGSDAITVRGDVTLGFDLNHGGDATLTTGGAWHASDFTAFGPTPAQQLQLYPAGDPRNSLPDPWGDLSGFNMLHGEFIVARPQVFRFDARGINLFGIYQIDIVQDASAGEGSSSYNFGTLAADFAHTSSFSAGATHDPLGVIDFSQARVSLIFGSPVPEPASLWLWLAGAAALRSRRRD